MFGDPRQMRRWIIIAVVIGLFCSSPSPAKKPVKPPPDDDGVAVRSYTIVKLGDEYEDVTWECYAFDINKWSDVVGHVEDEDPNTPSGTRAAYWDGGGSGLSLLKGGVIADETSVEGTGAKGINDAGEIVGYGKDSNGYNIGLYWANAEAEPLPLPPLSGDLRSYAKAINNQGVVCGFSAGVEGWQAVAWRINWTGNQAGVSGPIELATPDGSLSLVGGISNNDENGYAQIVGHFSEAPHVADPTAAVAWTVESLPDGTLTLVDTRTVENGAVKALGVNDGGTICGEAGWPTQAVVWIGDESWPLHLAQARDIVDGSTMDINNNGTIVGCGSSGMIDDEAVAWPSVDGKMVRLNKFVGRKSPFIFLVEASAVNDLGEIVGFGFTEVGGSAHRAFLAIPE